MANEIMTCGNCESDFDSDRGHYCQFEPPFRSEADKWLQEALEAIEK